MYSTLARFVVIVVHRAPIRYTTMVCFGDWIKDQCRGQEMVEVFVKVDWTPNLWDMMEGRRYEWKMI